MVYLNYNNLDKDTQERLLHKSKQEVEQRNGTDLKAYAIENHLNYEDILYEEAVKNLYSYTFIFKI